MAKRKIDVNAFLVQHIGKIFILLCIWFFLSLWIITKKHQTSIDEIRQEKITMSQLNYRELETRKPTFEEIISDEAWTIYGFPFTVYTDVETNTVIIKNLIAPGGIVVFGFTRGDKSLEPAEERKE